MQVPVSTLKLDSKMSFSNVSMGENFLAKLADEYLYLFAGKQSGINLLNMVHPDYQEEFRAACTGVALHEKRRIVTMLHDFRGDYHLMDLIITNEGKTLDNEPVLQLLFYNMNPIENSHVQYLNELNKYRAFLSMYRDFLYDYDTETGMFTIFIYLGTRSTPYIKCNIKDFYELAEDTYESEEEFNAFKEFYRLLTEAKDDFNSKLNMPFIDNDSENNLCQITSKVIYKINKKPVVIGIIKPINSNNDDTAPYYTTEEGRDPVTHLLNKRACQEYVSDILKFHDGNKHYMLVIDIDNFKSINDNYGHLFGDEVIMKVAQVISTALLGRGICGRFGGDEFFIFTTGITDETMLRNIITSMRKELLYAYEDTHPDFRITLSIGISLCPTDGATYDELFKKADKCLYIAKDKGKNRFVIYKEEMHGALADNEKALRNAFNPLEKAEFLGAYMGEMIPALLSKAPALDMELIKDICTTFELDGMRIYGGRDSALLYHTDTYKKLPAIESYINDDAFVKKFNSNNSFVISSVSNFESIHKEISAALLDCSIMSLVTFRFQAKDGTYFTFFCDVFNHSIRWNDSDKNYLLTLCKVITSILER